MPKRWIGLMMGALVVVALLWALSERRPTSELRGGELAMSGEAAERDEARGVELPAPEAAVPRALPAVPRAVSTRTVSTDAESTPETPPPVAVSASVLAPLVVEVVSVYGGNPVEGVRVRARTWDLTTSRSLGLVEGVTDLAGFVRIEPPVGELELTAFTTDGRHARANLLHEGAAEEDRVRLELSELAEVHGVVLAADGRPLVGARVRCEVTRDVEGAAAFTDESGRFVFTQWPQGSATALSCELEGYGAEHVMLIVDPQQGWSLIENRVTAWLPGTPFVEVTMSPEKRIEGRLIREDGQPVVDARVRVQGWIPTSSVVRLRDDAETVTDSTGAFALEGRRLDVPHLVICEDKGIGLAMRLAPADEALVDLGEITLEAFAEVSGRVVDSFGRPIGGALVELSLSGDAILPPGDQASLPPLIVPGYRVPGQTSRDGRFALRGPRVEATRVIVRLGERAIVRADVSLANGDIALGDLRADQAVAFVSGMLVAADASPMASARLEILSNSGRLLAKSETDLRGGFEFAVVPGLYESVTLMLRAPDDRLSARWVRDLERFPVMLQLVE